jgi:hypothetical protein
MRHCPPAVRLCAAVIPLAVLTLLSGCNGDGRGAPEAAPLGDPPEVTLGERLFLETRFAQFFAAENGANVNAPLAAGDPALDMSETTGAPIPGPFAGQSMNCRACHLVDEHDGVAGGGVRAYADFARRSPIPSRPDGRTVTPRNSPPLVHATLARANPFLLHLDGEFTTVEDLVRGTIAGRNYGWLPDERAQAVAHVAAVIRGDDGQGDLAGEFGNLPYRVALNPQSPAVPAELVIPPALRIDVDQATDEQIFTAVAALIGAYVSSLELARDEAGELTASPYDVFLQKNGLPRVPDVGESDLDYSRRLRGLVDALPAPVFVTAADGEFAFHDQTFEFGPTELDGLRIFLREPSATPPSAQEIAQGGFGNCVACHHLPTFTDFGLHNVGIAQEDYDAVHGAGAFANLTVPTLAQRDAAPNVYLPPSAAHPTSLGVCASVPTIADPQLTDLGLWNVTANADIPLPQASIRAILEAQLDATPASMTDDALLAASIAVFKTATLRDLGQTGPYMHTGRFDTIDSVVQHYTTFSALARLGQVRNADARLAQVAILPANESALAAFLRALNEDYD